MTGKNSNIKRYQKRKAPQKQSQNMFAIHVGTTRKMFDEFQLRKVSYNSLQFKIATEIVIHITSFDSSVGKSVNFDLLFCNVYLYKILVKL